jgi:hypothetical protein
VYVYFDNDAKVHAPWDAIHLIERVGAMPGVGEMRVEEKLRTKRPRVPRKQIEPVRMEWPAVAPARRGSTRENAPRKRGR